MFKSLDSIASVVGIFMYLTISKFKQVLRSRKGLDYNTVKRINFVALLKSTDYNLAISITLLSLSNVIRWHKHYPNDVTE